MIHQVPQRTWESRLKHMQQTHVKFSEFLAWPARRAWAGCECPSGSGGVPRNGPRVRLICGAIEGLFVLRSGISIFPADACNVVPWVLRSRSHQIRL